MKNQNHEIVPQKMNEIDSLNEIVELDLESLETIVGGNLLKVTENPSEYEVFGCNCKEMTTCGNNFGLTTS